MAKMKRFSLVVVTSICAAIAAISFSCSKDGDGTGVDGGKLPSRIIDLRVKSVTPTTVHLEWTAPGDEDTVGTAFQYDIRYTTTGLSGENWDAALLVSDEPVPSPFGSTDSMVVTGLMEDSTYYFGVKAKSHAGTWSALSDIISATCFDDFEVAFPDPNLNQIIRTQIGIATEPIHRSDLIPVRQVIASNESIATISGMEYCINLEALLMGNNQVSNVSPLSGLVKLTALQIGNNISDISPLANLVNLEQLYLNSNYLITDISAMAGMTKLTDVHLAFNAISSISALAGKTAMTTLRLYDNDISDISPLAGMTKLTLLEIDANLVSDISPLAASTGLLNLNLSSNYITDISVLAGMTKLEDLWLIGNQISDLSALSGLTALKRLYLSDNPIADVSSLSGMAALEYLEIHNCEIVDLSPLQGLTNLQHLSLNDNLISDIAPLVANMGLGSGDFLFLTGNPLSQQSIDVYIPALQGRGVTVAY